MRSHYIACAASSSVDHKTNELSLFHLLDEIGAETFPLQVARLCVATLFEREAHEDAAQSYLMAIRLDDRLLASFSMQVDFGSGRRNRSVNTIQGLAIPAPGRVTIQLLQKTELLATWTLIAFRLAAAAPAMQPTAQPRPTDAPQPLPRGAPTVN